MDFNYYTMFHSIGILVGFIISFIAAQKLNFPLLNLFAILFILTILIGIGGKIGGILFYNGNFDSLIKLKSETTIFGSFILFFIFNIILKYLLFKNDSFQFKNILVIEVIYILTIQFFGKLSCHFVGCCYGIPCSYWFCIKPKPLSYYYNKDVLIFPIQLIEAMFYLFLLLMLIFVFFKQLKYRVFIPAFYFFIYSIIRFISEYYRGDYPIIICSLKMGQLLSLLLFIFSLIWLLNAYIASRKY